MAMYLWEAENEEATSDVVIILRWLTIKIKPNTQNSTNQIVENNTINTKAP